MFPAQPQENPLAQHCVDTSMVSDPHLDHLKTITTFISGKEIEKTVYPNTICIEAHKSSTMNFGELEPPSSK